MKGKQITPLEFNSSSFDFIIRPLTLNVKDLPEGIYHLEFEKGISYNTQDLNTSVFWRKEFIFQNPQQIIVKLHNVKSSSFSWSLYRNHEKKFEYIDSVRFNLNDYFSGFTKDLKAYSAEYSHIMTEKAKNEPIGFLWKGLKTKLKNSSFITEASNDLGCIRLKYSLQIKGEMDYISEKEPVKSVKSKLSSKGSIESEVKSSQSRKSLLNKKTADVSTVEKTVEKEIHELKMDSIIKEDPENFIIEIRQESPIISPEIKQNIRQIPTHPSESPVVEDVQTTPFTPFIPMLPANFDRRTILSDIVQNSYEGSSNMHSGQLSDRKYKQLSEIPENSVNSNAFMKRKTYTFEAIKSDEPLRRINTHQSIKHSSQLEQEEDQEIERHEREAISLMKKRHTEAESEENTKQSSLKPSNISLSSNHSNQSAEQWKEQKQQSNIKSVFLLFILFIIFLGSAGSLILPSAKTWNRNIVRNFSKRTPKLPKTDIKNLFSQNYFF